MKVLFMFMSAGSAPKGSCKGGSWLHDRNGAIRFCGNHYSKKFGDECYFQMFQSLVDNGTITDLKVFFESGVAPGLADFVKGKNVQNFVIPHIDLVKQFIDEDTVIFIRGGFKHWHDFFFEYKGKNWLICYAANTGRDKWIWWDIVFDDLTMNNEIDRHNRYHFPFIKPTNEMIFKPDHNVKNYDLCLGASNIHDKKGQWKSAQLIEVFHKKYGYYPTAVMPGGIRRSTETLKMLNKPWFQNEVCLPGMLTKPQLSDLFASCKIFLHLGSGGQNDRSILEAHACGLPVILSNASRFTPLLKEDGISTHVFNPNESMEQWADRLFMIFKDLKEIDKRRRHSIYRFRMGYAEVVIPMLTTFFNILADTKPTEKIKERLQKAFKKFKQGERK